MKIRDATSSETADAIYNASYSPLWDTVQFQYWDTSALGKVPISIKSAVKESTTLLLFHGTFEPTMNITYMSLKDAI